MQTVNIYMLNDLLNPLGGTADIDEKIFEYQNLDINSEQLIKDIIGSEIKPYYESSPAFYKESVKRSMSYFLTTNRVEFGRLYDSCLIAFDHPCDPKIFFIWIWEVLFPGEGYMLENIENYQEIKDLNEPRSYFL